MRLLAGAHRLEHMPGGALAVLPEPSGLRMGPRPVLTASSVAAGALTMPWLGIWCHAAVVALLSGQLLCGMWAGGQAKKQKRAVVEHPRRCADEGMSTGHFDATEWCAFDVMGAAFCSEAGSLS